MTDRRVTITVPEETHKAFRLKALKEETSMNKVLNRAITAYLEEGNENGSNV
jgi:predicted HicB family RNase H-like nuclease